MAGGTWNFEIDQANDFETTVYLKDSSGDLIDLTGCDAEMVISENAKADSEIFVNLTIGNGMLTLGGAAGTIAIHIPNAITETLTFERAVYFLKVIFTDGKKKRYLEGSVTLSRERL